MRPGAPNPFLPDEELTLDELTAISEAAWKGQQIGSASRASVSRFPGSPPVIAVDPTRRIFARITGQGSGCAFSGNSGDADPPDSQHTAPNCYCGIEQSSDINGNVGDLEDGLVFDSFAFPLVEMSGNPDVPIDALVWASPSIQGTHYEFLWQGTQPGDSGSGCGSGCETGIDLSCLIRCNGGVLQVQQGCFYVMIHGQRIYVQFEQPTE